MTDIVQDYAGVGSLLTYPGHNVRFPVCTFTTALPGGLVPPDLQVLVSAAGDGTKTPLAHIAVIIDAVRSPADPLYDARKNVFRVWLQVERTLFCSPVPVRAVDIALYAYNGTDYQPLGDTFVLSKELKFTGPVTDYLGNTVYAGVVEGVEGQYALQFYPEVDEADGDGYIKVGSMYVFGGKPNSDATPYTVAVLEDDAAGNIAEGVKIEQLPVEGAADTTLLNIYYKPAAAGAEDFSRNGSESSQVYITVRDQALRTICRQFSLLPLQQPAIQFDYVNSGYADADGVPGFYSVGFEGLIGTFSVADAVDSDASFSLTPGANAGEFLISGGGALSVIGDRLVSTNDERQDIVAGTVQYTENGRTFVYEVDKHYYIFDALAFSSVTDANTALPVDPNAAALDVYYYPNHDTAHGDFITLLNFTVNDTVDVSKLYAALYDAAGNFYLLNDVIFNKTGSVVEVKVTNFLPLLRRPLEGVLYYVAVYDGTFVEEPETAEAAGSMKQARCVLRALNLFPLENPSFQLSEATTPDSHSVLPNNYPGFLWIPEYGAAINVYELSVGNAVDAFSNTFSFADGSSPGPYEILSDNVLAIEGFDTTDVITLGANTLQVSENGRQFPYASDINVYAYEQLAVGLVENLALVTATSEITQAEDGTYVVYYYPSVDNRDGILHLGSVTTTSNYGVLNAHISAPFDVVANDGVAYFTTPYSPGDLNVDTAALSTGTRDGSYVKDNLIFTLYDSRFQFDASISNGRTVSVTFKLYPISAPVVTYTWREEDGRDDDSTRGYIAEDNSANVLLGTVSVASTSDHLPEYTVSVGMVDDEKYVLDGDVNVYVRAGTYTPSSVTANSLAILTEFGETKSFVVNENDRTFYADPADGTQFYLFKDLKLTLPAETVQATESVFAELYYPVQAQYGLGTYSVDTSVSSVTSLDTSNPYATNTVRYIDTSALVTVSTYAASETAVDVQASNFHLTEELGVPADGAKPTQWAQFVYQLTVSNSFGSFTQDSGLGVWNDLQKATHAGKTAENTDTTFTLDDGDTINIDYRETHSIPFSFFVKGGIRIPTESNLYNATISIVPGILGVNADLALTYSGVVSQPITFANNTITVTVGDQVITFANLTVHFYTPMVLALPAQRLQFVKIIDNSTDFRNSADKVYRVVEDGSDVYTVGSDGTYGPGATPITYIAGHPLTEFGDAPTITLKKLAFGASGDGVVSDDATLEWVAGTVDDFNSRQIRVTDVDLDAFAGYSVEVSSSSAHDPTTEWVVRKGGILPKGTVTTLSSDASTVFFFELVNPRFNIVPVGLEFDPTKTMVNFAPNSDTIDYSPKVPGSDGIVTVYPRLGYNAFKVLVHNPAGIFALNNFKHSVRIGFVKDCHLSGLTYDNLPDLATHKLGFVNGPSNETHQGYIDVNVRGRNTYQVTGFALLASIVAIVSTCDTVTFGKYKLVVLSKSGSDLTLAANGSPYDLAANGSPYDYTVVNDGSIGFAFNVILWTTANVYSADLDRQDDLSQQWPDHLLLQFTNLTLHEVDGNGIATYPAVDVEDPSPVFTYELQAKQTSLDDNTYATLLSGTGSSYADIQSAIAEEVFPERKIELDCNGKMPSWVNRDIWLDYRVRIENDAIVQSRADLKDIAYFYVHCIRSQTYTKGQFTDFRVPQSHVTVRETLRDDASLFETIRVKSEVFSNDGMSTYVFNLFPLTNPVTEVQTEVTSLQSTVSTNATNLIVVAAFNAAASAAAAEADYKAAEAALATVRFAAPAAMQDRVDTANANVDAAIDAANAASDALNIANSEVSNAETLVANATTALTDASAARDLASSNWSLLVAGGASAELIEAARLVKEAAELAATNAVTNKTTELANLAAKRLAVTTAATAASDANAEAARLQGVRNNAVTAQTQVAADVANALASVTTAFNNSNYAAEYATTARNATTTTDAVEAMTNAAALVDQNATLRASVASVIQTIKITAGL